MAKPYFITTSIPYVNDKPHIGHALEYVQTDVLARYQRLLGNDVFFQTGTDEHGQKNWQTAKKRGLIVTEFVKANSELFLRLCRDLDISFDRFIRTEDDDHKRVSQWLWNQSLENGDLYEKEYQGYYCVGCESFKMPADLENGRCPEHTSQELELIKDKNWFFRLSKYRQELTDKINAGELKIYPAHRAKETLNFLEKAEDVSVSRSKEKLPWGILVPNDSEQVMYVWFDALTNYLTGARIDPKKNPVEKSDFKRWPADLHVVGKDIYRFHTVIWQAMLLSAGFPLAKAVLIHGFINLGGQKMSKSEGRIVDPRDYLNKYGADALRYYLLRYIPVTEDGDFSDELFGRAYNSDLANDLGNLVQRTLTLIKNNQINISGFQKPLVSPPDWYQEKMQAFDFAGILINIWQIVTEANVLINKEKPWELVKTDPKKAKIVLGTVYKFILDIAYLLSPFLPATAAKINNQLESLEPKGIFPRI